MSLLLTTSNARVPKGTKSKILGLRTVSNYGKIYVQKPTKRNKLSNVPSSLGTIIYLFIYYLICECRVIKVPEARMVPKELKEDRLVLSVTFL